MVHKLGTSEELHEGGKKSKSFPMTDKGLFCPEVESNHSAESVEILLQHTNTFQEEDGWWEGSVAGGNSGLP